jgi:hypothetical protein
MAADPHAKRKQLQSTINKMVKQGRSESEIAPIRKQLEKERSAINKAKKTGGNTETGTGQTGVDVSDPNAVANAAVNNSIVNEEGPLGSSNITKNADGTFTKTTKLEEGQQELLDQDTTRDKGFGELAQTLAGQVGQSYSQPFNLDGMPYDPRTLNLDAERKRQEDAYFQRRRAQMDPGMMQEQEAFKQRMANEGVPEGSPKYQQLQQALLQRQKSDLDALGQESIEFGGRELQSSFDRGLRTREASINDEMLVRNNPFQELTNVLSQRTGPRMPQTQAYQPADVAGIYSGYHSLNVNDANADADRRQQMTMFNRTPKGGSGGGGAGPIPFDEQLARRQAFANQDWENKRRELEYMNSIKGKSKSPNAFQQFAQSVAPAAAAGIMKGIFS